MPITVSNATNAAVKAAQDVPDLLNKLNAVDPGLAQQLNGKGLLASRTAWGAVLVPVITYLAGKYFGWSSDTTLDVLGVLMAVGGVAARLVTKAPIAGLLTPPPPAPKAAP
jgi:hypothetical protein